MVADGSRAAAEAGAGPRWPAGSRRCVSLAGAVLVVLVGLAVGAALVPGRAPGLSDRFWLLAASTGFVLAGVLSVVETRRPAAVLVLLGLVHCWLGDMLGAVDFTVGGVAFLTGHLWFAGAFCAGGLVWRRALVAAGVLAVTGTVVGRWLLPRVGGPDIVLVTAYMAVISAMAAAAAGTRAGAWRFALAGAALFYVSDIVVADWRFVHSAIPHRLLCYPLYYAACMMLGLWPAAAFRRCRAAGDSMPSAAGAG